MRRGFDWWGLTLPGVLLVGAVSVWISTLGNGEAFAVVGWILVGVAVLALPFWLIALIRSRTLLARAKRLGGAVCFVGAPVAERRFQFAGFAPLVAVVAGNEGVRAFSGRPLTEQWYLPWSALGALSVGELRVGRTLAPTIEFDTNVVRVLHDNGWTASFRYAEAILVELAAARASRTP